jgi:hypothetical protein
LKVMFGAGDGAHDVVGDLLGGRRERGDVVDAAGQALARGGGQLDQGAQPVGHVHQRDRGVGPAERLVAAGPQRLVVHQRGVVGRPAAGQDRGDEAGEADGPEVEAVAGVVVGAEQFAGDLGDAVHGGRLERDVVADRLGQRRAERGDRAGEEDLADLLLAAGLEQVERAGLVDRVGALRVGLAAGAEDRGEVEHALGADLRDERVHGGGVGDVEAVPRDVSGHGLGERDVAGVDFVAAGLEDAEEIEADLTACTGDEDLHARRG